jgi:hypothetical protein
VLSDSASRGETIASALSETDLAFDSDTSTNRLASEKVGVYLMPMDEQKSPSLTDALFMPATLRASALLDSLITRRYQAAITRSGAGSEIVIVPPALGLYPPLDTSLAFIAEVLASRGYSTTLVSFPGQHGNAGMFSVARSCFQLAEYLRSLERPFSLFGICSGALAALAASLEEPRAYGVFCWDLSSNLQYSPAAIFALTERYGMTFCERSALLPVQAPQIVPFVRSPIIFAYPPRSYYVRPAAQRALAAMAPVGRAVCVPGVGHFPGVPRGSERVLAHALCAWAEEDRRGHIVPREGRIDEHA